MPNHCENNFTVRGKKQDVIDFIASCVTSKHGEEQISEEKIKEAILEGTYNDAKKFVLENFCLFRKLKPMPDELYKDKVFGAEKDQALIDKYGSDNWYDWANDNWGTKWGCYDTSFDSIYETSDGEFELQINYNTAWAPGDDFLMENLAVEDYKHLKFHLYYEEPGMGFHGFFFIKDGSVVENNCETHNQFPESMSDALDRY
ncbi:hypothetical protein EB001_00265 [bacterium]|nr:hypothetical protein [bacterium]